MVDILKECRANKDIVDICCKIIKENNYNNLKIFVDFYVVDKKENKIKIIDLFNVCRNSLDILNTKELIKEKYIYKVLLKHIKSACIDKKPNKDFDMLMSTTFLWRFNKVEYKNKKII